MQRLGNVELTWFLLSNWIPLASWSVPFMYLISLYYFFHSIILCNNCALSRLWWGLRDVPLLTGGSKRNVVSAWHIAHPSCVYTPHISATVIPKSSSLTSSKHFRHHLYCPFVRTAISSIATFMNGSALSSVNFHMAALATFWFRSSSFRYTFSFLSQCQERLRFN